MKTIPRATYRIQFSPAFTFDHLKIFIPFLSRLGISCIYASPIFKARKGSAHGYDVVDFNEINPELGGADGFAALISEVKAQGMEWLQDFVPNHMAFSSQNQILVDVGENGQNSKYYDFFDVEWDHPYEGIKGRVLAPFLGSFYGECLENGEIRLCYDEQGFAVKYHELRFPLRLESYADVLTYRLGSLRLRLPANQTDYIKLHGILGVLFVLRTLPSGEISDERYDQIKFIKVMLWELYSQNAEIQRFIDETIQILNDRPGLERSICFMEKLLGDQHYRLSHWKVAVEEINYRRFFNINELISLRMENQKVFNHVHHLISRLIFEGSVAGLRIDHIDGLYDPLLYLQKLNEKTGGVYTVVEKILGDGESLPQSWPIFGTTGYDFLNIVNGIFCETRNEKAIDRIYAAFTKGVSTFAEIVYEKKKFIAERRMAGDLENLAHLIKKISARYRRGSDLTMFGIKRALVQVLAHFPVYRTYFNRDTYRPEDRQYIDSVLRKNLEDSPDLVQEFDFIRKLHDPEFIDSLTEEDREEWLNARMRFQQLTAPLMAKGFEDTAMYVFNRLLSLNEVGGFPGKFGIQAAAFHAFNLRRVQTFPHALSATSTHDSKRGEDVRARLNILSEIPKEWARRIRIWKQINRRHKTIVDGQLVPEANVEYGLYQTLLGAYPFGTFDLAEFRERMKSYAVKAVREAKTSTSWLLPDVDYEKAVVSFVESLLQPPEENIFLRDFLPFQKMVAFYGVWNSLSQTLLKIASPGVPDFYQGSELWDLNLVDPDNRRPVDFSQRADFLREIRQCCDEDILALIAGLLASREDGRLKLFMIHRALKVRFEERELFEAGAYFPVKVRGKWRRCVVAFARQWENNCAVVAVPRFLVGRIKEGEIPLGNIWEDTSLSMPRRHVGPWQDRISRQILDCGNVLSLSEAFRYFPAALLLSRG